MNSFNITGRVFTVPKIRILSINGQNITVCNFTVAIIDDLDKDNPDNSKCTDFIECICFNDLAMSFNYNFEKGSKIFCSGKLKNHFFEDCNRTKHFTQVLLLTKFEFGDSKNSLVATDKSVSSADISFSPDVKTVSDLFSIMCDHGYLCIDEDDYYRIAMNNYALL